MYREERELAEKQEFFAKLSDLCGDYNVSMTAGPSNKMGGNGNFGINLAFNGHDDIDIEYARIDESTKYESF